jgi:hypothetical protein
MGQLAQFLAIFMGKMGFGSGFSEFTGSDQHKLGTKAAIRVFFLTNIFYKF